MMGGGTKDQQNIKKKENKYESNKSMEMSVQKLMFSLSLACGRDYEGCEVCVKEDIGDMGRRWIYEDVSGDNRGMDLQGVLKGDGEREQGSQRLIYIHICIGRYGWGDMDGDIRRYIGQGKG